MAPPEILESCGKERDDEDYRMKERLQRGQWIRAAILGANDGLLSTTSLMLGVGAAKEDKRSMLLSGLAGALAGACSMAVGEFVSVSTQRDIEKASAASRCSSNTNQITKHDDKDTKCAIEKKSTPAMIAEPCRLPTIFSPGLSPMMRMISENASKLEEEYREDKVLPNPFKAASASGLAFLVGSFVPLVPAAIINGNLVRMVVMALVTSIALAGFGGFGAQLGGSSIRISAARVVVGGWIGMGITYGLLKPFDSGHRAKGKMKNISDIICRVVCVT